MAITYRSPFRAHPDFRVPILHKIVYNQDYFPDEIRSWCDQHCKEKYYISPSWVDKCFVQFEDFNDAVSFGLIWT